MNYLPMRNYFLLIVSLFIFSCSNKDDPNQPEKDKSYLVNVEENRSLAVSEMKELSSEILGSQSLIINPLLKYGVTLYKITYNTQDFNGKEIIASGAVIVPTGLSETSALVSFQHGTITSEINAPSNFELNSESGIGSLFGATGYIIAMPDYVGYGASKNEDHPYENKVGLSVPTVDFLKAVKEFIKKNNINWNNNLLLTGYSEGGYATLAAQKLIEEKYSDEFNLVASSCGAGAYNKSATVNYLLSNTSSGNANFNRSYIWVLLTYNSLYKINKPMSYYFKEPYASQINSEGAAVSISESLNTLFNDDFKTRYLNGQEVELMNAVKDNDIFDWKPITPTQLYHGDKDDYVPYINSETAYQAMKNRGANNVELKTILLGNHASSVPAFLLGTYSFFESHKND